MPGEVERQWIALQDYLDGLAFSQLAPWSTGSTTRNVSGLCPCWIAGSNCRRSGFCLPSFLMVVAIGEVYVHFSGTRIIAALFYGIGAAVIGIIARSAMKLVKTSLKKDWLLWGVFVVLALSTAITEQEAVWLFLAAGFLVMLLRTPPLFWKRQHVMYVFAPFSLTMSKTGALFAFFLKASLFVFGSGLAIVPFLHGGVVQEHQWLTEAQFLDAVAVAMITPGPVVITAAFVGYLVAGVPGACAAALGVFLPVYLSVILVAPSYKRFSQNKQVRSFVQGVTAAATGAIAGAVVVLAKHSVHDAWTLTMAVATFLVLVKWKIPEPIMIVLAGALGVAIHL
jgi:chromate transporter